MRNPYVLVPVGLGVVYLYALVCIQPTVSTDTELLDYWVNTIRKYSSSPVDMSVMSPVQGLGGLVLPFGVSLDPVHCLPHICRGFIDPAVSSRLVGILLLSGAVLALARLLGLRWLPSVLAAQTVAVAYFPPNVLFDTGMFYLSPCNMTLCALSVGFLCLFLSIGKPPLARNLACLCALPCTVIYAVLCNPGFAPVFLAPSLFIACGVLVGSPSWRVFLWRLLGGASALAIVLASGIPRYYHALTGYCARGWFPNELYVEVQRWNNLTPLIFKSISRRPLSTIAATLLICCCGAIAGFRARKEQKGFVAATLVYLALMVYMTLIYIYSGVRWSMPLPDYLDVGPHAAYLLTGLLGLQITWEERAVWLPRLARCSPTGRIARFANSGLLALLCAVSIPTGAAVNAVIAKYGGELRAIRKVLMGEPRGVLTRCKSALLRVRASRIRKRLDSEGKLPSVAVTAYLKVLMGEPRGVLTRCKSALLRVRASRIRKRLDSEGKLPSVAVTAYLKEEVGLGPDGRFRGAVASVVGVPGGEVARQLDFPDDAPFSKSNISRVPTYLQKTFDKNLSLTGLWNLGIPTLEDYTHLVTPPIHFLFSRVLSRPQDFYSRNWSCITRANPKLLSALGVRLILTDRATEGDSVDLEKTVENSEGVSLRVYAIPDPNLGHYSPTCVRNSEDASDTISLMRADGFSFRTDVIVHDQEIASSMPPLVTAKEAALFYEKGGVRVKAASNGPALILLPLQFSNCLRIVSASCAPAGPTPQLLRCDLVLTGLVFQGDIDVKIAHVFGPFVGIEGRLQDIRECRELGIKETGEIPYPPDYQPLAEPDWVIWRPLHAIVKSPYGAF